MTIAIDPFDPQISKNPYPHYERLRREAPVYRSEPSGFFMVTRYDDVMRVFKQPDLFSSTAMMTIMMSGLGVGTQASGLGFQGADAARMLELFQQMPIPLVEFLKSRMLIASDPPIHGPLRNLVNRGFTPKRIAALEPRIREIARACLEPVREKGDMDLVHDFSIPLPVTVIAELLGIETERRADFKRWSDVLIQSGSGSTAGLRPETVFEAFRELDAYLRTAIERRRSEPSSDLIGTLVAAEESEAALSTTEVLMFVVLLLIAGNETTTNLIGNGMIALSRNAAQLSAVQREPERIPALVEEILRYDPPIQILFRRATRDTELAGVRIPKDATVLPCIGAAHRDERQFPDPDRFDIERSNTVHLGFGFGIHFCLGASLARLEARVAFEELLGAMADFELAEPNVPYIDSFLLRGPKRLPIHFTPARNGRSHGSTERARA